MSRYTGMGTGQIPFYSTDMVIFPKYSILFTPLYDTA